MKNITEITNREEIIEQLAHMLQEFNKQMKNYQTDVYCYIDETGAATLDLFVNVGGRSWLDDNHITLYSDYEHFMDVYDFFCNTGDFADGLEIEQETLRKEVAEYLAAEGGIEKDEITDYKPNWSEIKDYIKTKEDYIQKLQETYEECIDESLSDYLEMAEAIIEKAEEEERERQEYEKYWK